MNSFLESFLGKSFEKVLHSFRESVFLAVVKAFISLIAVGLDAASSRFSSKTEKTAAAAIVGIGLVVGSTADVQAACDPPGYDVCFHKRDNDWSTAGLATMIVEFDGIPGKTYRYRFSGWMENIDYKLLVLLGMITIRRRGGFLVGRV